MTNDLVSLRQTLLELLREFTRVCEEKGLKYYAFYGTLLGIRRNGGFVPWDDDIDVAMPASDYLELCAHKEWFDAEYLLQTPLDSGFSRFAKLHKAGTTAFRGGLESLRSQGYHGIYIDIIPLAELSGIDAWYAPTMLGPEKGSAVYLKFWLEPHGMGQFEDMNLRTPAMPDMVLRETYGDWTVPDAPEERQPRFWFFDTEKGAEHHLWRYTGLLEGIAGKKLLLFGAGGSLHDFLASFGLKDQVVCTFANSPERWGQKAEGVLIRDPMELPGMMDSESRVVIVSIYHQEIGRQLKSMGIEDYYVYVDRLFGRTAGKYIIRNEAQMEAVKTPEGTGNGKV